MSTYSLICLGDTVGSTLINEPLILNLGNTLYRDLSSINGMMGTYYQTTPIFCYSYRQ